MLKSIIFILMSGLVFGYPNFMDRIPNGDKVPNPCPGQTAGTPWHGVGHNQQQGAGPRNSFGQAFANAGYKWTKELCQLDSDQDNQSNGAELGDPLCAWSIGHVVTQLPTGHPGICEPMTDAKCTSVNTNIICGH